MTLFGTFKSPPCILEAREKDAKRKLDFFHGLTNEHPHGASGLKWIIPYEESKSTWDTAPRNYAFSEYGWWQPDEVNTTPYAVFNTRESFKRFMDAIRKQKPPA